MAEAKEVELTDSQKECLEKCENELEEKGEAVIVGPAGSGKTTLSFSVRSRWPKNVLFMGPTGKAAVRLTQVTGKKAETMHSALYGMAEEVEDGDTLSLRFGDPSPITGAVDGTLIIVDEASMVGEDLAADLRKQAQEDGAKVLWMGDHYQLPPVKGTWGVNLLDPTAELTEIHRQALDNPIIDFATKIRLGEATKFNRWDDRCSYVSGHLEEAVTKSMNEDMQVLTYTNRTRIAVNNIHRKKLGYNSSYPRIGETLVCLQNNKFHGIMNGEQVIIDRIEPHYQATQLYNEPVHIAYQKDCKRGFLLMPSMFNSGASMWHRLLEPFKGYANIQMTKFKMGWSHREVREFKQYYTRGAFLHATWGYCLTCHKSQGSQWSNVMVLTDNSMKYAMQRDPDFGRRLLYTAVTRASKNLCLFRI